LKNSGIWLLSTVKTVSRRPCEPWYLCCRWWVGYVVHSVRVTSASTFSSLLFLQCLHPWPWPSLYMVCIFRE